MSNNAHDLSNRLLNALDNNYNVVDMHAVNEIISILEKINITKELLETTRLGKHVNELRRKTTDPTLARRAKVLVKRWRDLVIPAVASPAHTGSNRASAERQVRRLGGTPLTSPALTRHVVSPAVPSPRPPSRPAWGGYESDSQDVILVDDDPPTVLPPPPLLNALHKPVTPPIKRQPSPEPLHDDKKAKRDKKPKKRRGHSRAGSGTETTAIPEGAGPGAPGTAWSARNGSAHAHTHAAPHTHTHTHAHAHERRRNGCRRDAVDPYAALVNRLPPAGAKKVKTTKELLEQIQSRGSKAASRPVSPASPASPDVMLIEPDSYPKVESPLRNGSSEPKLCSAPASPVPSLPLDDEFACEREQCTCGEEIQDTCPAAVLRRVAPAHVHALHNALVPGVNGTRAPLHPHQFAVRKLTDPDKPGLFTSVVPLYKYSDYADDYCVKNISRVPICTHLPWTEFAPPPPDLPAPPSPPPPRPYPVEDEAPAETEVKVEPDNPKTEEIVYECPKVEAEMVGVPNLEPSERLKAPLLSVEEKKQFGESEPVVKMEVQEEFASKPQEHRTVERTKEELDGKGLYALCESARSAIPYTYEQASIAPVVSLSTDRLEETFAEAAAETTRDELDRPPRPVRFAEWHECAKLGDLIALPYVVID